MPTRALKRLAPVHEQAMALRLWGLSYAEIGAQLHRHEATVAHWFVDAAFRAKYDALAAEVRACAEACLIAAAPEAARTLVRLLDADSEMVAFLAAKDILDRVLGKPSARQPGRLRGTVPAPVRFSIQDTDPIGRLSERREPVAALPSGIPEP